MTVDKLQVILEEHKKWLEGNGGRRADLRGFDLRWFDLQGVDLQLAGLRGVDLRWADLRGIDLRLAELQGTDLRWTNLQGADLRGAELDYSVWPLWCGSLDVKVDKRIAAQLAYHFCRVICENEEVKAAQKALAGLANQSHLVDECGRIET